MLIVFQIIDLSFASWFFSFALTLSEDILRFRLVGLWSNQLLFLWFGSGFSFASRFSHLGTLMLTCILVYIDQENSSLYWSWVRIIDIHLVSCLKFSLLLFIAASVLSLHWSISHLRVAVMILTLSLCKLTDWRSRIQRMPIDSLLSFLVSNKSFLVDWNFWWEGSHHVFFEQLPQLWSWLFENHCAYVDNC